MTGGKRASAAADRTPSRPSAAVRVVEYPPVSATAPVQIAGAGQGLFSLFRDELVAFRRQQRASIPTPAREVSHV